MTIDVDTIESPGWWLKWLSEKLVSRNKNENDLFLRYENEQPVPESLRNAPESARHFFKSARTAFAEMIVKSVKYPLKVSSVLTAEDSGDLGDSVAWRIFSRSGMEEESDDVHRLAILAGNSYGIVQWHDISESWRYTSEDPREVITQHDPTVQSEVITAAKFYYDAIRGQARAILWDRDRTYQAYREQGSHNGYQRFSASWSWDESLGGAEGLEREHYPGAPRIPVFRYRNEEGVGEFKRHRSLLDRVEHMVLDGMTIATYQAFKQRAIKVNPKDMPDFDPKTGQRIDYDAIFSSDPGALWKLPETAEMWESGQVDLTPVWTGIDKAIQQLAAVTFTPLAMFAPEGQNQSAAGSSFAREGRTFKIEDRQDRFGRTHAKALSLLMALNGEDERTDPEDIEIVWRPAERHSLTERTSALVNTSSMPWQARMEEIMGYSPRKIERMKRMREEDALIEAMFTDEGEAEAEAATVPGETEGVDAGEAKDRFDALGVAIRAGVSPTSAAQRVGLSGVEFTGAVPAMLRMPGEE